MSSYQIRDIGAEKLNDLVVHLKSLRPLPLRPDDLHDEVKKRVPGEVIEAESLLRPILALSGLIRQWALSVDEVIEGLRSGIRTSRPEWTDTQLANWKSIEPHLQALFEIPAVRIVTKATDLACEHANLLKIARIITDIRPFSMMTRQTSTRLLSLIVLPRDDSSTQKQDEVILSKHAEPVRSLLVQVLIQDFE